ncbi:MAG: VWA domain-containing protein [Candidatus Woesearchaeota archaeon]
MANKSLLKVIFLYLLLLIVLKPGFTQKDNSYLTDYYPVEEEKVDYIFVVDRSGTMRSYWPSVKDAIIDVVNVLPNGDYVSVLGFDASCYQIAMPRKITNESKGQLINDIGLSINPNGAYTDLFESTNTVLEEINRPQSNRINFVYYFTDYLHDPPADSKWNNQDAREALNQKYSNLVSKGDRLLWIYAIQLPLSQNAGRDYNDFSRVFDNNSQRIFLDVNSLDEWFDRNKAELKREKLKLMVLNDFQDSLSILNIDVYDNLFSFKRNSKICLEFNYPFEIPSKIQRFVIYAGGDVYDVEIDKAFGDKQNEVLEISYDDIFNLGSLLPNRQPFDLDSIVVDIIFPFDQLSELNLSNTKTMVFRESRDIVMYGGLSIVYALLFFGIIACLIIWIVWRRFKPEFTFGKKKFKYDIKINDKVVSEGVLNSSNKQAAIKSEEIAENLNFHPFTISFFPKKSFSNKKRGTYVICNSSEDFYVEYTQKGKPVKKQIKKSRKTFNTKLPDNLFTLRIYSEYYLNGKNVKIEINLY